MVFTFKLGVEVRIVPLIQASALALSAWINQLANPTLVFNARVVPMKERNDV